MNIQSAFYILGIISFVLWLVVVLVVLIGGLIAYRKIKQVQETIKKKGALAFATVDLMKKLPLKKMAPVITAIPLLIKVVKTMTTGKNNKKLTKE